MGKAMINEFPVVIYGNLEQASSPVVSKARVRIFYKYENRNGSYISDEFAEKLIQTLPYTPVKGIYDGGSQDYMDHGRERTQGRIYGIVPENPNFAWEQHIDEDGVSRTYGCADVLIFSALYPEAADIIGKPQSMELYADSIDGEWVYIRGRRFFKYTEGCFLGLQILGEQVEPCFEGAAFFSLDTLKQVVDQMEEYVAKFSQGGNEQMSKINFKISDSQKFDAIWSLLNDSYTEEGEWIVTYGVCDIYDDYALCYNYEAGTYERVYYTKDDETDTVELGERVKVFVIDVTEAEFTALNALRAIHGDTYEKVDEDMAALQEMSAEFEERGTKIEELEASVATLTTEAEEVAAQFEAAKEQHKADEATISELTEEVEGLKQFKLDVEKHEKEEVLSSYAELLSEDVLAKYTDEVIASYSAADLDKELAYELKQSNPSVFSQQPQIIPTHTPVVSGIEAILTKYQK